MWPTGMECDDAECEREDDVERAEMDDEMGVAARGSRPGGEVFREFVYAMRNGRPWYAVISISTIICRAPLHAPFLLNPTKHRWDPEAKPLSKRGCWLYVEDLQ